MNWDLGEGELEDHFCPVQKIFAPLRLCAFASKMAPTERPLRTELAIFLARGYKYFAPMALPATSSMPRPANPPAPLSAGTGGKVIFYPGCCG
jgi:hypothetical protein